MTTVAHGTLAEAYATCEQITQTQARNFYYGIRLLPRDKRAVLCAVYALARRIDDVGDGDLPLAEKQAGLELVRKQLGDLSAVDDPVLLALEDAARRFPLPLEAFDELVDGVEMDLVGRRYETFDQLVDYCRCVAGTIGRLCLGVFGSRPHPQASAWADSLGIALQQTNILRDIREDLLAGRVYLPQEDLDRHRVTLAVDDTGRLVDEHGGLSRLVRTAALRADDWYVEGLRLVPLLDHRSAASCSAMAGIYRRLLQQIHGDPSLVFDRRLSLTGKQKAAVAVRSIVRAKAGQVAT